MLATVVILFALCWLPLQMVSGDGDEMRQLFFFSSFRL